MYPPPASLHTEVQALARTHSTSAVTPAAPAEPPAEVKVTYMLLPLEEVAAGVTAALGPLAMGAAALAPSYTVHSSPAATAHPVYLITTAHPEGAVMANLQDTPAP